MTDDYKTDLTPANEHGKPCARHDDRRAEMLYLENDGTMTPLCYDCWSAYYPEIRMRLAEQRLILGGLPNERTR